MGKRRAEAQEQTAPGDRQGPPSAAAPESSPATSPELVSGLDAEAMQRLKELADLHEQGVLTDQEFATQKARILG
jgi:hypothetical protein